MRILIIDDDPDDVQIFREAICQINPDIECLSARDGDEALTLLRRETELPEIIFLDVNMPVMDGKECLIQIKRNIRYKNIKTVIYSTSSIEHEVATLKKLGAKEFIFKTSSFDDLVQNVNGIIQTRRSSGSGS
jgi:CheY-like chemotaxis protein